MHISDTAAWQRVNETNVPPDIARDPSTWPLDSPVSQVSVYYGAVCVIFAERWAELMETALSAGENISQCAERCERDADQSLSPWNGITGFQYSAAVSILSKCWVHGEDLRRWHNSATQLGTEGDEANKTGGVLNAAVLKFNST